MSLQIQMKQHVALLAHKKLNQTSQGLQNQMGAQNSFWLSTDQVMPSKAQEPSR